MIANTSKFSKLICTIFLLSVVVFPNAFRFPKLGIVLVLMLLIFPTIKRIEREALVLVALGIVTSLIYLAIGVQLHVDSTELIQQTLAAYVIAPLFWVLFANYYFSKFSVKYLINLILVGGALACLVTYLCFWLWEQGYLDLYALINGSSMINAIRGDDGYAIILNLFGSLIFISSAIMSVYIGRIRLSIVVLTFLLLSVAFISGRTALLFSFGLGGMMLLVLMTRNKKQLMLYLLIGMPIGLSIVTFLSLYFSVDTYAILDSSIDELLSGGGSIRSQQIVHLIDGINDSNLLGAGHGSNVINVRYKGDRPWSYEVLFFATVLRVGVLGTIIYALPLIYSVTRYIKLVRKNVANSNDHFLFFGLIAMCAAIFTNPYFESIDFQWTYFIPYVYFLKRSKQ